ncbi:protein S40-4-like [Prosopis cineraria]|uniref:protein S40-4-like n=1 Tax=Prosopis cineraria TaxID=364024 RepID=UPI002410571B|nr:protein S40-4-like [Prosopis cineraria]
MASRKGFLVKPSFTFATASHAHFHPDSTEGVSKFDEAELWNLSSNANSIKEASRDVDTGGRRSSLETSGSLPVNIPNWSNILKGHRKRGSAVDEDEGDEHGEIRIPPHEYLARTRGASFSVQEGIGRTLKGRDLCSVRNAVWKKVGFED